MDASTVPLALPAPAGDTLIIYSEGTPSTPKFEKLRDDNWFAWKTRMSIVLRRYSALEVATGLVKKPEDSKGAAIWNNRDFIAQELIAASIKDEQVIHISECKTSAEMWSKLRTVYEPNMVQSTLSTKIKLYTTAASEGANLIEHIKEMKRLRNRLSLVGCLIEEDEFKLILVSSFPPSWKRFTAPFFHQDIRLTSQELVTLLCEEYRRRKEEAHLQDMGE